MPTKPNQPKSPANWIKYGGKLLKLAQNGGAKRVHVKKLQMLLSELDNVSGSIKKILELEVSAKSIEKDIVSGCTQDSLDMADAKRIIFDLNELGTQALSAFWQKFGKQISDDKHKKKFYPIKVKNELRFAIEDTCMAILKSEEDRVLSDYFLTYKKRLNLDDFKAWLKMSEAQRGENKHDYDEVMLFVLQSSIS